MLKYVVFSGDLQVMKYSKYLPSAVLQPHIREFILLESELYVDSRAIPDTAMIMSFRYRGKVAKLDGDRKEALPATGISGLRKTIRAFQYDKQTSNLLVVFKEGRLNAFTRLPAHELFGQNMSCDNIFPSSALNELLERLADAADDEGRIKMIEAFLIERLNPRSRPDLLIGQALQVIQQQHGIIRIKELAASLYISQDAFEKRFRSLVGATPKQYASIVRMKDLIKNYPDYASLTDAAHRAGYFDQSHFIKDFRLFTGVAPKEFFSHFEYW